MNDFETDLGASVDLPPVKELSKPQRRVLGTLIEKAFTVPESYPMTLKGLTVGCNQKSNRDPMTTYTEDAVLDALDELRKLGLVAVVHTESGRTERYRHYARKRFPFTEPQLAIMTELLLRGRQQMGELRARASRMVPLESLDDLRREVEGLMAGDFVQSNGPLDRRGVEVDHCLYSANEHSRMAAMPAHAPHSVPEAPHHQNGGAPVSRTPRDVPTSTSSGSREFDDLQASQQELKAELLEMRRELQELRDDLTDLRQSLGA